MHTPPAFVTCTEGRCKNSSVSPRFTYRPVSAVVDADARVVRLRLIGFARWLSLEGLTMNSHKNTLSNILQNPPTNVVRSLVFVYAYMGVRSMYMPIMAVKTRKQCTLYQVSGARSAQLIEFLFVFDIARNRRMKASFIITAKDRKVSFALFFFLVLSLSFFLDTFYKISITIKS